MKPTILFPAQPFEFPAVDHHFQEEKQIAELLGFPTCIIDFEELLEGRFSINMGEIKSPIIYRGWMLKSDQYDFLYESFWKIRNPELSRAIFGCLINTPFEYTACHQFPPMYSEIKDYTPKSIWSKASIWSEGEKDDSCFALQVLRFMDNNNIKSVILKDYVKSEKANPRLFRISSSVSQQELTDILSEFKKSRGSLFDTGFVVKHEIKLKIRNGRTNEYRAFVFCGEVISIDPNSNQAPITKYCPDFDFVEYIAKRIFQKSKSNFFTVDFAEADSGAWWVLEYGDGQVSGLAPNKNITEFYKNIAEISEEKFPETPRSSKMTLKEKKLAKSFLEYILEHGIGRNCNDVDESFYDGWTIEERQAFNKESWDFNGSPEDYNPKFLHIPDYALASFLLHKMFVEIGLEE